MSSFVLPALSCGRVWNDPPSARPFRHPPELTGLGAFGCPVVRDPSQSSSGLVLQPGYILRHNLIMETASPLQIGLLAFKDLIYKLGKRKLAMSAPNISSTHPFGYLTERVSLGIDIK